MKKLIISKGGTKQATITANAFWVPIFLYKVILEDFPIRLY